MVMTPKDYIIGIILFTLVVGCCATLMNTLQNEDSSLGTDYPEFNNFNSTFNKYDEIDAQVSVWQSNIENVSQDNSNVGVWDSLISGGWSMLSLLGNSLSFMKAIFISTASILGVPSWVAALLYMIIIVIIVFSVYSAVFRRDL